MKPATLPSSVAVCLLALLCLSAPVTAATTQVLPFFGYVTNIETFYAPGDTVYPPPVPPVALGDLVTGTFSTYYDQPFSGAVGNGLSLNSGSWHSGFGGFPLRASIGGGQLSFQGDGAQQFVSINLIDPAGGIDWQAGTVSASDRSGYPYSWWRFTATLASIPDGGTTAGMLGGVFALLVLIQRINLIRPKRAA